MKKTWAPRQLGCDSRVLHRLATTQSPRDGKGSRQAVESPKDRQDVLVEFVSAPRRGIMNCSSAGASWFVWFG